MQSDEYCVTIDGNVEVYSANDIEKAEAEAKRLAREHRETVVNVYRRTLTKIVSYEVKGGLVIVWVTDVREFFESRPLGVRGDGDG